MDKKYQVFISSTYLDLIPEREKVRDVILSMYHFPIGMEMFNAADEEQWEIIQETIESSDYYVLIIGKRYGTVIPEGKSDAGISYTEKEYRYAVSHGIPVLTFIKNDSAVTADKMDTDPENIAKLTALVKEITAIKEADWFSNADELAAKVSLALHKQMDRKKRPGWVRGDRFDVDASLNELVVLSQRVRELEEENKKLRESAIKRNPALNVSMQFVGTVENPLKVDEGENADAEEVSMIEGKLSAAETLQRQYVAEHGYIMLQDPISMEDVPDDLKEQITPEMLENYNSNLPDKDTIEEYEKSMRYYNEVHKNGQLLDFIIANDGTAKATDINITLEFPKSFQIMERSVAEKVTAPRRPRIPSNPIDEARTRKALAGKIGLEQMIHQMAHSYAGFDFSEAGGLNIDLPLLNNNFSSGWSVDIKGQTVEIWSRDLLHTYTQVVDELCIIPQEKGTFKIKVSMMCEEYIQPETGELEIVVE